MKLFLDKGHYGLEPGACYQNLKESDLTHLIVEKTFNILKNEYGVKDNEVYYGTGSLQNRTDRANNLNCDLFVSIHINSTMGATGIESFYSRFSGQTTRNMAKLLCDSSVATTGLRNRGAREDYSYLKYDLHVLQKTKMNAILLECGFIQNDWKNVEQLSNQFAKGIANFIVSHYNLQKVTTPVNRIVTIQELKEMGIQGVTF